MDLSLLFGWAALTDGLLQASANGWKDCAFYTLLAVIFVLMALIMNPLKVPLPQIFHARARRKLRNRTKEYNPDPESESLKRWWRTATRASLSS